MKHLGDITKISGHTAPIVDCIIGGSPCQDLSVAGKRAGLDGERSGLFMEQIRIIKEMRDNDRRNGRSDVDVRPRYMVWENVPGALSSNKGEDFRVVLEEVARISEEGVTIPRPEKGKWSTTGVIIGDGYSIAWRVFDAQYWGVPQRRRRICLVADFNGYSAAEVLFNEAEHNRSTNRGNSDTYIGHTGAESQSEVQSICEGLSGDTQQSKEERKGSPTNTSGGFGESYQRPNVVDTVAFEGNGQMPSHKGDGYSVTDKSYTLNGTEVHGVAYSVDMGGGESACDILEDKSPTLCTTHYREPAVVYDARGNGDGKTVPTMTGDHQNRVTDYTGIVCYRKQSHPRNSEEGQGYEETDKCDTLNVFDNSETRTPTIVVKYIDISHADDVIRVDNVVAPLQARDYKGGKLVASNYIVRRLTPLECERLQGFPDGWTDIGEYTDSKGKKRKTSDASRYKALGNSIALPSWKFVLKRICANYERPATMASLFDGIGGFPLIWEQINGKGSCLWASEIEEFPIAVTKRRIG